MAWSENEIENDDGEYIETFSAGGVPNLNARAAILYDVTYDRILFEKNAKEKRANASTTKMLTALVAYENGNLDDVIEISKKAASTSGSSLHLKQGDKITLDSLIKGMLIRSGNDAAVAIAEYIAEDENTFSSLMNKKAEQIGARDTHFVTPHGLDEEQHYTTATDLMLIAKDLLNTPYLVNIVSQKQLEIVVNGEKKLLTTTNELFSVYEGINGVKTGYTGRAGRCLVASAKKRERQLISVVLGCDSKKNRTIDTMRLLDYGFQEYHVTDLTQYAKKSFFAFVEKSEQGIYQIKRSGEILYPIKEEEKNKITVKNERITNLKAPLKAGEYLGNQQFYLGENFIKKVEIYLPEDIQRKSWKIFFQKIFSDSLENYENMVEKIWKL